MSLSRLFSLTLVPVAALCAVEALAYIPPSEFIVKSWVQKHGNARGVRARAWVSAMDGDKPSTSVRFRLQAVARPEDGFIRWSALDEQGHLLYVLDDKSEGPFGALLFDSGWVHVVRTLKAVGIPVKTPKDLLDAGIRNEQERAQSEESGTLSLARAKRTVAWVIGKKDPSDSPQLWVEKDSFVPVLLKTSSGEASLESYRFFHDFPFPRIVTWTEGKNVIFRMDLADFTLNPPELGQLKAPVQSGFTEAGNSASGSVRDLIQKFFEKAR